MRPHRIIADIKANAGGGMVGFVGVQSNQFPHAMDMARPLAAAVSRASPISSADAPRAGKKPSPSRPARRAAAVDPRAVLGQYLLGVGLYPVIAHLFSRWQRAFLQQV